jgi:type I restriction enzyme M protein
MCLRDSRKPQCARRAGHRVETGWPMPPTAYRPAPGGPPGPARRPPGPGTRAFRRGRPRTSEKTETACNRRWQCSVSGVEPSDDFRLRASIATCGPLEFDTMSRAGPPPPASPPIMPTLLTTSLAAAPREIALHRLRLPASQVEARVGPAREGVHAGVLVAPVASRAGEPFLWIVLAGDLASAERAAEEIIRAHPFANTAIAATGADSVCTLLRYRPGRDDLERASSLESLAGQDSVLLSQPFVGPGVTVPGAIEQRPLTSQVEDLLFELHSDLRDIDGMHPDAALDELCKLILAKTYDERHTLGVGPVLQRPGALCDDEVASVARSTYDKARALIADDGGNESPGLRGAFSAPFLCSSHALARLVDQLAPYHLTSSGLDIKARAFQRVLAPAVRAGMGQFFTPAEVIRFMVTVAAPQPGECVADPFAGSGHFLAESTRQAASRETMKSRPLSAWAVEKSDRMVRVAYTDLLLHDTKHVRVLCSDSLLPFAQLNGLGQNSVDVVLTNPPFGSLLRQGAISRLGPFTITRGRTTAPLEVLGLERCVQLLRPGGRLGIVLPDGVFANTGSQYVRDWIASETVVRAIVSLPIETFAPYGANVKTSILFARKRMPGEKSTGTERVLMASVGSVGYDAAGRSKGGGDLDEIASRLVAFLAEEKW